MAARRIILDCDPGQDDAVNLLLAMAAPDELDILGITAVAGNVPLSLTQRNARLMCDVAGRADLRVYAGCSRPMVRQLVTAEQVHGNTGIDGMEVTDPAQPLQKQHAVDFIVEALKAAPENSVTLVPTGPLTNIAMAMVKDPSILTRIERIVLMGGAMREGGNSTPSAEFNIFVDPHAAHVVFESGRPIVAMGLDVSHQVLATTERIAMIEALGNRAAVATAGMLGFFNRHDTAKYGIYGAPLHDPCTVAWLLKPDLFEGKLCHVAIETGSPLTMGHTAVDFWGVTGRDANATWMHRIDADGFYELLVERLARFDGA
jgi:purine nucleosidase